MKTYEGMSQIGEFYLFSEILMGQLKIDGENSELKLHSREFFHTENIENKSIKGILSNNQKVSLIDCITLSSGSVGGKDDRQNYSTIFPHYVVFGEQHIDPTEEKILALNFIIEDATALFYDYDAFGSISEKDCDIKDLLFQISGQRERRFEIGECPKLFYYTGKHNIFKSETVIGKVSASHCPSWLSPSPEGIDIKNFIPIRIEFNKTTSFEEAIKRFYILLSFADIIIGTPQHITYLSINVETAKTYPDELGVYCCMQPKYDDGFKSRKSQPMDMLIDGAIEPENFSQVLSSWLGRQEKWRDSRMRFIQSFRRQNSYSINRLVAAANMFDILPADAVGKEKVTSAEVKSAVERCEAIFKDVHACYEKESILSALGRVNKHSLKTKVKNRAKLITEITKDKFPDLELVIDEAINSRNFYVHGTKGKLSHEMRQRFSSFFTDTLEFIFGASDLIDSGWDIKKWANKGSSLSHPFARYIYNYPQHLKEFKEAKG